MSMTMRVSLPGYDALTDGTIDHYSIYADSDNILVKELMRGTINVSASSTGTVNHNLGYVPFARVAADFGGTAVTLCGGGVNMSNPSYYSLGTNSLFCTNLSGTTRTYYYYIFYDRGLTL